LLVVLFQEGFTAKLTFMIDGIVIRPHAKPRFLKTN
jgi:hypothetical protein